MSERLRLFQKENAFNSSEIATLNSILARESQYSTTCSLGAEEAGLVVAALISDPVSASFSQGGAGSSAPDMLGVLVSISVIIGGY